MWTSGATDAGSSSVPARTNRTRGLVYWLYSATWQLGHRQILCLPRSRGTSTDWGSPASSSTLSVSISTLTTNALPVWRWQLRQWQQWTKSGSDVSRYRTSPQEQPPRRSLLLLLCL